MKRIGSRAEVYHGNAMQTSGRLVKADLMKNAAGRIISKKRYESGKKALKYLHAKGYIAVKGAFGCKQVSSLVGLADAPKPPHTPSTDSAIHPASVTLIGNPNVKYVFDTGSGKREAILQVV